MHHKPRRLQLLPEHPRIAAIASADRLTLGVEPRAGKIADGMTMLRSPETWLPERPITPAGLLAMTLGILGGCRGAGESIA
jgi:hypothetical protein